MISNDLDEVQQSVELLAATVSKLNTMVTLGNPMNEIEKHRLYTAIQNVQYATLDLNTVVLMNTKVR